HCLLQTKNGNPQHFLLQGERGIGKSSLLLCAHCVAEGRVLTQRTKQKLDYIIVSVSLVETDDHFSIIRKIMSSFRRELAKRNAFKAFVAGAWEWINRFEAGGIRYDRNAAKPEDSELLEHLKADFVKAASSLDGVADGILMLVDEADKPPAGGNLGL